MLNQLIHFDQELFLAINQGLRDLLFDLLPTKRRNPYTCASIYRFLVIFFVKKSGNMGILIVDFTLAKFGISDALSSQVIKKNVKRIRPCNDLVFKPES